MRAFSPLIYTLRTDGQQSPLSPVSPALSHLLVIPTATAPRSPVKQLDPQSTGLTAAHCDCHSRGGSLW